MAITTDRIAGESFGVSWRASRSGTSVSTLVAKLLVWLERARERRQLLALGDHALKDFGATRADAAREAGKPCWRA